MSVFPWQEEDWSALQNRITRLPHALLFTGPAGMGKRHFVETLAARLLCESPTASGFACDACTACHLRRAGNHPDLFRVVPASDEEGGESPTVAEDDKSEKPEKAKSSQILIEQIRTLQGSLTLTGHQSPRRVVILDPVEAMNANTANALLKLLEEPPEGAQFLLISSQPWRILPTVLSRCQRVPLTPPSLSIAETWLKEQGKAGGALLSLVGGQPLEARRLADSGGEDWVTTFIQTMKTQASQDPLRVAATWETWLKSKEIQGSGFDLYSLVDWVLRWVYDLTVLRLGGTVRFFPQENENLRELARKAGADELFNCYNDVTKMRQVARHPLNARLFLEDLLLRYARALKD